MYNITIIDVCLCNIFKYLIIYLLQLSVSLLEIRNHFEYLMIMFSIISLNTAEIKYFLQQCQNNILFLHRVGRCFSNMYVVIKMVHHESFIVVPQQRLMMNLKHLKFYT